MQTNESGKRIYGNSQPPHDVWEGDGPPTVPGYVLVAAPGAPIPADVVARYDLGDRLKAPEGREPEVQRSVTGERLVTTESGRAVAESIAPAHLRAPAESKAVRQSDTEDKAAAAPGTTAGATGGAAPTMTLGNPERAAQQQAQQQKDQKPGR